MISVHGLTHKAGDFSIDVSLEIAQGEYFVLLGMTGSGKTLFLETLCGLRQATAGTVVIGGKDVTDAQPRDRRVGYVAQDGALFSHLSVEANIGFSLAVNGVRPKEQKTRARQMAGELGIEHLLGRRMRGLSGGERQRVALARAMAANPAALLLDEPVSALDEYTRENVCSRLRAMQRSLCIPVIHVCHSFEEAMLVADTIGIMQNGKIAQSGVPERLIDYPANVGAARILRHPNILSGIASRRNGGAVYAVNGMSLNGPPAEGSVRFIVKPWLIRPLAALGPRASETDAVVNAVVGEIRFSGPLARIVTSTNPSLTVQLSRKDAEVAGLAAGSPITLAIPSEAVHPLGNNE